MTEKHVNIAHARSEDQIDALRKIEEAKSCPFCGKDYLEKEHKKPILAENEHWIATENRWPYKGSSVHLLFIHKKHVERLSEVGPEEWKSLKGIVEEMSGKLNIQGATLVMRFGESKFTGATVSHIHAQLISGKGEEGGEPVLARVG